MPRGKISRVFPERGFGFITPDDESPDVHFYIKDLQEGKAVEGVSVEFELVKGRGGKGPHAGSPKVIEEAQASAAPKIEVGWEIRDPETVNDYVWIAVAIVLRRGDKPVRDTKVKLFRVDKDGNEHEVVTPAREVSSDPEGKAWFQVFIDWNAPYGLKAKVGRKIYTHLVSVARKEEEPVTAPPIQENPPEKETPAESAAAPAEPSPELLKTEKMGPDSEHIYRFCIYCKPGQDVTLNGNIEVVARPIESDQWTQGPFRSDTTGRLELLLRAKTPGTRGEVTFSSQGVHSLPRYVARPQTS